MFGRHRQSNNLDLALTALDDADTQGRRGRRGRSTVGTVVTAAVIGYGAYKLVDYIIKQEKEKQSPIVTKLTSWWPFENKSKNRSKTALYEQQQVNSDNNNDNARQQQPQQQQYHQYHYNPDNGEPSGRQAAAAASSTHPNLHEETMYFDKTPAKSGSLNKGNSSLHTHDEPFENNASSNLNSGINSNDNNFVVLTNTPSQNFSHSERWKLRRQRMTRCREEAAKALEGFLPTLQQIIDKDLTNTTKETQMLKKLRAMRNKNIHQGTINTNNNNNNESMLRAQERDLWDDIKIKSVTRMMSTAYAHTVLFLVLTVQVNLLGGRLLEEQLAQQQQQLSTNTSMMSLSVDSVASERLLSYQASHRFVLQHTYEYFFQHGLASLVRTVESAVCQVMAADDWNVMEGPFALNLSREVFEDAIQQVRDIVEGNRRRSRHYNNNTGAGSNSQHSRLSVQSNSNHSTGNKQRSLLRFLMPPSAHLEMSSGNNRNNDINTNDDDLARSILDETWDILESPVMMDAHTDCLSTTFQMMRDRSWGSIFENSSNNNSNNNAMQQQHATVNGKNTAASWTTKPLAQVLTQLKHTSSSFYQTESIINNNNNTYGGNNYTNAAGMSSSLTMNSYIAMMEALPSVLELGDVSFN